MHSQKQIDVRPLLITVCILVTIGTIFIYSASSVYALELFGSANYFVIRQLVGIALGLVAAVCIQFIPQDALHRYCPALLGGALLLTGLTLVPSLTQKINGSARWLNLAGLRFQPSELLKVALILYLAHLITKKAPRRNSFMHGYLPVLLAASVACVVLLKQPDFGSAVTIILTTITMLFVASYPSRHMIATLCALMPIAGALIAAQPYRLKRITTFLNPWDDPLGAGFQTIQSLIAIGSGGLWGVGIANSKQKFFYLPMQHTDFIFSIIAEETGFIGSCVIISLLIVFFLSGMRLASRMHNPFASLSAIGFTALIGMQGMINLGVSSGLLPTKGIGLPFVSYGNTALVSNLLMIGLMVNFARNDHLER